MMHQQCLTSPEEQVMLIQFLTCRDEGHKFLPLGDHHIITNRRGELVSYQRTSTCRCCETKRVQHIDGVTFEVIKNTYTYPEGYLLSGDDKLTRRQARKLVFQYYHEGH